MCKHSYKTTPKCGDNGKKDTPVPIPNTAVKLLSADGSWTFGPVRVGRCHAGCGCLDSAIAQLAERMTVNHDVVGSSPTCGVKFYIAALAQQVERIHGKDEVAGSSPASGLSRSI